MTLAIQSFHDLPNLDLSVDTRYPLGDKPQIAPATLGINLAAFNAANINLVGLSQNGTPVSINYRQYLTGSSAASATITVNAVTGSLQAWTFDATDTDLVNPLTAAATLAQLQVSASDQAGNTALFPAQSWSILAPIQQTKVKWNPGHYMASAGTLKPGQTLSNVQGEIDNLNDQNAVIGYRLFVGWGALDLGPVSFTASVGGATSGTLTAAITSGVYWTGFADGEYRSVTVAAGVNCTWSGALNAGSITSGHAYTFAVVDSILSRLKTAYNQPKHLILAIQPMSFGGSLGHNDADIIPLYIQNDSGNGNSPVSGSYGWWGSVSGGASNGSYTAAIYRASVMNHLIGLYQALGAKYDSEPYFEGTMLQEDSATTGDAINLGTIDGSYSDAAFSTQLEALLTAAVAAFPTTTVGMQNTFIRTATPTQALEGWMMSHRIMPCATDTKGDSKFAGGISWGEMAVLGITAPGSTFTGPDMRSTVRFWCDVEGPDLGAYNFGTRFFNGSPTDTLTALNNDYQASHAFWTYLLSNSGAPSACWWPNLAPVLAANPLIHTAYPGNYP